MDLELTHYRLRIPQLEKIVKKFGAWDIAPKMTALTPHIYHILPKLTQKTLMQVPTKSKDTQLIAPEIITKCSSLSIVKSEIKKYVRQLPI